MFLKRDHLIIREATISDAALLCKWWNDGNVMNHAGFPNGLDTTETEVINLIKKDTVRNKRLIIESYNKPIGEMNYRQVADGIVEIGIKICDLTEQEKGYGTNYLKLLIEYLFNDLEYKKIVLDTNLNNLRAQHVYEKIGFRKVKVNVDAWKNQLGILQTSIDYELTKEDYLNMQLIQNV